MRSGPEFDRIRSVIGAIGSRESPDVLLGPGDDAAVIHAGSEESIVVSSDLSVEHVHFRREWLTWDAIGFRAVASALSDLAAMGARPIGALLSVAVPPELDLRTLDEIASGMGACLREHETSLLGGDLSRSPGPVVIDVTVLGAARHPVGRDGARDGDELWVTGRLGGAALAASAWAGDLEPEAATRRAFERPKPRLREARLLCDRAEVHAMIDLSDGLAGDAEHIAAASGVCLLMETENVPLHRALEGWSDPAAALALAVGGGEDYELLLAVAPGSAADARRLLSSEMSVDLTQVGRVTEGRGVRWVGGEGSDVDVPTGFDHFGGGA
jgi:thiamine-monophosphate kinase